LLAIKGKNFEKYFLNLPGILNRGNNNLFFFVDKKFRLIKEVRKNWKNDSEKFSKI